MREPPPRGAGPTLGVSGETGPIWQPEEPRGSLVSPLGWSQGPRGPPVLGLFLQIQQIAIQQNSLCAWLCGSGELRGPCSCSLLSWARWHTPVTSALGGPRCLASACAPAGTHTCTRMHTQCPYVLCVWAWRGKGYLDSQGPGRSRPQGLSHCPWKLGLAAQSLGPRRTGLCDQGCTGLAPRWAVNAHWAWHRLSGGPTLVLRTCRQDEGSEWGPSWIVQGSS